MTHAWTPCYCWTTDPTSVYTGTLIYLGTVDLLSEEFSKPDVAADLRLQRGMMLATVAGAAVMAALAIYA